MEGSAFSDKVITADEAARLVKPGSNVFVGTACAAPSKILAGTFQATVAAIARVTETTDPAQIEVVPSADQRLSLEGLYAVAQ